MAEFTGERLVPGQVDADLYNEHFSRYAFAARLARHRRVLDVACGTGYGSAELARTARTVFSFDIAPDAVANAAANYQSVRQHYFAASATFVPLADASVDLVVAYEVIEHIEDWPRLLDEAKRVLAPGGQFVLSTPNKDYYTEGRGESGPNPFHVHEFTFAEFKAALEERFPSVMLFVQNHVEGILFQPVQTAPPASEVTSTRPRPAPEECHFFVAVCAMAPQTGAPSWLYLPDSGNVLREREHHIAKLNGEVDQKNLWLESLKVELVALNRILAEREEEIEKTKLLFVDLQQQYKDAVAGYSAKVEELESELKQRTESAAANIERLESELTAQRAELARAIELLHQAERTVEERTLWAQGLDARVAHLEQALQTANGSRWLRLGRKFGVGPDLERV